MPETTDITKQREDWLNHKVKFWIQLTVIIVGIVGAWSTLRTDVELVKQQVNTIEGNHLVHIQIAIDELKDDVESNTKTNIEVATKLDIILDKLEKLE